MKKIAVLTLVILLAAGANSFAESAAGSGFGNLMTARSLGQGVGNFGGGVGIADATSFFGSFTYGLSKYMDGRIKIGMYDQDPSDAEIMFGADLKWQMWGVNDATANHPIDLAFGGLFEYLPFSGGSILQFGGYALGSHPFALSNGHILSPYGRLNLRLEKTSFDVGDGDSNLEFGVNVGVAWQVSSTTNFFGEFQLDGNDGLFLGIDFNVM